MLVPNGAANSCLRWADMILPPDRNAGYFLASSDRHGTFESPVTAQMHHDPVIDQQANAGTWVVVAVYNEVNTVAGVLTELRQAFPNVVAVDDGSQDGSWEHLRAIAPYALRHVVNRGQGAALQTGTEFALKMGAIRVAHFDADGQHRVEDLVRMVAAVARGECDVALGDRFRGQSNLPASRAALIRGAAFMHRFTSGIMLSDVHNGLRVLTRQAALKCEITADRMAHASQFIDLVASSRLRVRQYPTSIRYTEYSMAKGQRATESFRILFHYVIARIFG